MFFKQQSPIIAYKTKTIKDNKYSFKVIVKPMNEEKKYTQEEWEQIRRKQHIKDTSKGVVRGLFKCYCYLGLISVMFVL